MTIDFNTHAHQLFTPVFYKVRNAKTRYVVVYGGSSSGKSYAIHQSELINILQQGQGDTLIMRKAAATIRDSSFKLLQTLISKYKLRQLFNIAYSNDQRKIVYRPTGRSILFKGIDDPENLKSIVGIRRIIMEEASQFNFTDFLELNRRARGIEGLQTILILNPISENHWIKKQLCEPGSPYYADTTIIRCTYHDNCNIQGKSFLTESDIKELERLKDINENQYNIYVNAQWGVDNKQGKFCWAFHNGQIKPTIYDPSSVLWATFDFNINPLSCTVAQIFGAEKTIRAIECIKLENSDIWKMCQRLQSSYPNAIWMVTGDATGQSRSAMVADNMNYFSIIQSQLQLSSQQLKVPSVNPRIEENSILLNAVHKNWTVEIDPDKCQPLIYDLQYVEMNGRGEIIKDRSSGSKFADFLDNWRYLINTGVKEWFN